MLPNINIRKSVGETRKIRIRFREPTHTERSRKLPIGGLALRVSFMIFRLRARVRKYGASEGLEENDSIRCNNAEDATTWGTSGLSTSTGVKDGSKEAGEMGLVFSTMLPAFYVPLSRSIWKKLLFNSFTYRLTYVSRKFFVSDTFRRVLAIKEKKKEKGEKISCN